MQGLYFSGLTSVNVLNAGYMVFFIVFIMSEQTADQLWIFLVVYAELVVILLGIWQVEWTRSLENSVTQLIGPP